MSKELDIQRFLNQEEELEAFITGPAGSGKTTKLHEIIVQLNKLKVNYQVVAYTHKAKDVLIEKLPENTMISTLHSFLKKRPGINSKAKHVKALMTSNQYSQPAFLELLIIDEFSFVGEKDYMSLVELQDEGLLEEFKDPKTGKHPNPLKVLYVGDLNQLSPVDGPPAVYPCGSFQEVLTTIHRTSDDTDIHIPLAQLVDMIEGRAPVKYIESTEYFDRNCDINELYKEDKGDKIMLAYTNKAVQTHNTVIQGYAKPKPGDMIYSSTLKQRYKLIDVTEEHKDGNVVVTPRGDITYDTKYNPLQFLERHKAVTFFNVEGGISIPGIFGSYTNKIIREKLGKDLVQANKEGKDSKKLYREYKAINDFVSQFDFEHCMTIHKSQGSEYSNVYIDSIDLSTCFDMEERMKLLYVAMSRSKNKIFLNN
jgi:hypothetical protein